MPSVINLTEKKRFSPAHDEWATIGVHLATRVAQGQTREQAVAAVAALGVHPGRIQRYIKREGLRHPGRISMINALYTREENAAILQWLEYQISSRWKYEDRWELAFHVAKILLYEQNSHYYEMLEKEQREDGAEIKNVGVRAVKAWWRERSDTSPWEELLNGGRLDERTLFRFRSEIWLGEYEYYG